MTRRAEFFDDQAREWEARGFSAEEELKVERLRRRLGSLEGLAVLEPGCGAGRLTQQLARLVGPAGKVIAVEVSQEMAEAAARTVAKKRTPATCEIFPNGFRFPPQPDGLGEVEIIVGKAEEFRSGAIDLVLLFCVFPHFEDQEAALRHFRGMLKPEGRLVIAHLIGSERLNCLHEAAGEAVRADRMAPGLALIAIVRRCGLRVRTLVDWEEEFYLEAVVESGKVAGVGTVADVETGVAAEAGADDGRTL